MSALPVARHPLYGYPSAFRSACRRWCTVPLSALLALAAVCATAAEGSAATIVRNFVAPGGVFPSTGGAVAGNAPANAAGGGDLITIFNAAADFWEAAILDPWVVTINFGWSPLAGGTLGIHNLVTQVPFPGAPTRETVSSIRFDNDGSSVFFLDPTPLSDGEYTTFTASSADLGGGVINTGRVFTGATGLAAGRTDLFSVALHEVGHTLGLSSALTSFQNENGDLDIDVVSPRPFAGTVIPTTSGAHLSINTALMFPSIGGGIRRKIAGVDVLANAEISDWNNVNLDPQVVPSPPAVVLFAIGAVALGLVRRQGGKGKVG